MQGWWVSDVLSLPDGAVVLVSWATWIVVSIVLHELGHGYAALAQGDRTPRELGHITLNPLVHMGVMSLVAFALLGIAWGAMPVNPSRFRSRYGEAIVAAAGPAVNVALVVVASVGLFAVVAIGPNLPGSLVLRTNLVTFFDLGIVLNVALLLLNLLPVPPLDGSRILSDLVPSYARLLRGENAQWLGLALFAGVFFFGADLIFGSGRFVADQIGAAIAAVVS
ncbi:MAG: site-2 protease family protein [Planctomycetota bacterium]